MSQIILFMFIEPAAGCSTYNNIQKQILQHYNNTWQDLEEYKDFIKKM